MIKGWLNRLLAAQLRRPHGLMAGRVARLMNRYNTRMSEVAVETLDLRPSETVLEIGFGGGPMLRPVAEQISEGGVLIAVDPSVAMVRAARRAHADLITTGRLEIVNGAVEALPVEDNRVDAAYTSNTIYFWSDLDHGLAECARILKPGGRLAIAVRPLSFMRRAPFTKHGFALYEDGRLEAALASAGFADIRVTESDDDRIGYRVVTGRLANVLAR